MAASEQAGRDETQPKHVTAPLGGLKSALLIAVVLVFSLWFFPLFHVVSPMLGLSALARSAMISAAVLPVIAQWSLFWTTWKNSFVSLVLGS